MTEQSNTESGQTNNQTKMRRVASFTSILEFDIFEEVTPWQEAMELMIGGICLTDTNFGTVALAGTALKRDLLRERLARAGQRILRAMGMKEDDIPTERGILQRLEAKEADPVKEIRTDLPTVMPLGNETFGKRHGHLSARENDVADTIGLLGQLMRDKLGVPALWPDRELNATQFADVVDRELVDTNGLFSAAVRTETGFDRLIHWPPKSAGTETQPLDEQSPSKGVYREEREPVGAGACG